MRDTMPQPKMGQLLVSEWQRHYINIREQFDFHRRVVTPVLCVGCTTLGGIVGYTLAGGFG